MSINKKLVLFTMGYPYGNSEVTFLHEEVKVLKDYFNRIIIIPLNPDSTQKINELPNNVEVLNLSRNKKYYKRGLVDYIYVMRLFIMELRLSKNLAPLKHLRYHLSELLVFLVLAKEVNELIKQAVINEEKDLLYTYWFDEGSSALAILKGKYNKRIKFISRAHGFDVYAERNKKGYIFPRGLQLKFVDRVYTISEDGKKYLAQKFPEQKEKFVCSRLGTKVEVHSNMEKKINQGKLTLVSCSSIIPLKRVRKIIDILKFCKQSINWIHFGDGSLKNELVSSSAALPSHVTLQLRGHVENDEIKEFYAENHIDWFINVSQSEGIPVSIMEAISYGIPIIAPAVGGIPEIVNATTGILISEEFNPEEVANLIDNVSFTTEQRAQIIEFWQLNYSAQTNFNVFAKELQSLVSNISV